METLLKIGKDREESLDAMSARKKLDKLTRDLKSLESLAVAFSGGADSAFLLKVARDILGKNVLAVTAHSAFFPEREFAAAAEFSRVHRVPHRVVLANALDIEGFSENPPDRCYLCKRKLFSKIAAVARESRLRHIADGSNFDDLDDHRPGARAARELGIVTPLQDAEMTKQDIRVLSREMNLPTWDKPADACLATRIPYGQKITPEKLLAVERAEQFLLDAGFRQVRVRHHGDTARIEVAVGERILLLEGDLLEKVDAEFKKIGFIYAALDLRGYRTGSMHEGMKP